MAAEVRNAGAGPLLVAIEGIDGSGKTTLASALTATLTSRGISTARHREPSDGPAGRLLRSLSKADDHAPMVLALLSAADRHDQQQRLGRQGAGLVISDRYYLSGLAYHAADGIDQLVYQHLNQGVRRPALYLFLDVDPRIAAARLRGLADRWERSRIAAAVPCAYEAALQLVQATENARIARLDAAAPPREVLNQALAALASLITVAEGASRG